MTSPDYVPKRQLISNVTNAEEAVVTTTAAHGYSDGDYVMIVVPDAYNMWIDYKQTKITVTGLTTFSTTIDTRFEPAFGAPAAPFTQAHVCQVNGPIDNIAT